MAKTKLQDHEEVCAERYRMIDARLDEMNKILSDLVTLKTSGALTIKMLLWIGGAVAGLTAFAATVLHLIRSLGS